MISKWKRLKELKEQKHQSITALKANGTSKESVVKEIYQIKKDFAQGVYMICALFAGACVYKVSEGLAMLLYIVIGFTAVIIDSSNRDLKAEMREIRREAEGSNHKF